MTLTSIHTCCSLLSSLHPQSHSVHHLPSRCRSRSSCQSKSCCCLRWPRSRLDEAAAESSSSGMTILGGGVLNGSAVVGSSGMPTPLDCEACNTGRSSVVREVGRSFFGVAGADAVGSMTADADRPSDDPAAWASLNGLESWRIGVGVAGLRPGVCGTGVVGSSKEVPRVGVALSS